MTDTGWSELRPYEQGLLLLGFAGTTALVVLAGYGLRCLLVRVLLEMAP